MVAMPKLLIRGWVLEAGTRVRLSLPKTRQDQAKPATTHQATHHVVAARDAARRRTQWQRTWYAVGGH